MLTSTYKLIREDSVLVAQPLLIHHYGRVGASLIQQIHYWSEKGQGVVQDHHRWIHNTAEQWAEQLCVSASTIKRAVQKLTQDGVIRVQKMAKHKSNQTNSYTLNHERLKELMDAQRISRGDDVCETHTVGETCRKAHRVKMPPSSGQSEPMVIQRLTYKDINNKSETCDESVQSFSDPTLPQVFNGQAVQQVVAAPYMALPPINITLPLEEKEETSSSPVKTTTAQDMISVWNSEVSFNKKTECIKLNRAISKYLVASYKYKFNEDLEAWKHYCRLIDSSPYLMGQGFNLSLTWALKFATIDRILAGELGVVIRPLHEKSKSEETLRAEAACQALAHIDEIGEGQGCKEVRRMILAAVGASHYNAWFTQVDILDDGATLKPHNRFVEAAIQARFGDVLERVVI